MAPKPQVRGGRPHVLATKLSDEENAYVEAARGSLSRSMWLRKALLDYRKTHPEV